MTLAFKTAVAIIQYLLFVFSLLPDSNVLSSNIADPLAYSSPNLVPFLDTGSEVESSRKIHSSITFSKHSGLAFVPRLWPATGGGCGPTHHRFLPHSN